MRDLSMHVLDISMNSVRANATFIEITINQQVKDGYLDIVIKDNGCGMNEETLNRVTDPFYTTRTTRKIGLGIPLLKTSAERCEGSFVITSCVNEGTTIKACFKTDHIDCPPIGNMNETMLTLITVEPTIDYRIHYQKDERILDVDTREMRAVLKEVPLNSPLVIDWLKKELNSFNKQ